MLHFQLLTSFLSSFFVCQFPSSLSVNFPLFIFSSPHFLSYTLSYHVSHVFYCQFPPFSVFPLVSLSYSFLLHFPLLACICESISCFFLFPLFSTFPPHVTFLFSTLSLSVSSRFSANFFLTSNFSFLGYFLSFFLFILVFIFFLALFSLF